MENSTTTIEKLSIEFSRLVREYFTPEQLEEVIAKNATTEYARACATHDYFDANMIMDEAFQNVMGREFIFIDDEKPETEDQSRDDTYLFNEAWGLSKEFQFKNVAIEPGVTLNYKIQLMRKNNTLFSAYTKVIVTSFDGKTLIANMLETLTDEVTGEIISTNNDKITFVNMSYFNNFFKF